ncbi:hypothetical protein SKB0092_31540 [Roseomonas mucosa]
MPARRGLPATLAALFLSAYPPPAAERQDRGSRVKQAYATTVAFNVTDPDSPTGEEIQRFSLSIVVETNPKRAEQRAAQNVMRQEQGARIRNVLVLPLDIARIQAELAKP